MSKVLQRKYYARKIEGLRSSNSCNCWRSVKLITGQKTNTIRPMTGLANQLHDGDMHALADSVNHFFTEWPPTLALWKTALRRQHQT